MVIVNVEGNDFISTFPIFLNEVYSPFAYFMDSCKRVWGVIKIIAVVVDFKV